MHAVPKGVSNWLPTEETHGNPCQWEEVQVWWVWQAVQNHWACTWAHESPLRRKTLPLCQMQQGIQDQGNFVGIRLCSGNCDIKDLSVQSLTYLFVFLRMPCRCIRGPMATRNLMCVSIAQEASGRKVLWCDISAITPERSLSSVQSAIGALLNMGLLIGICALKVSMMERQQNKYLQQWCKQNC